MVKHRRFTNKLNKAVIQALFSLWIIHQCLHIDKIHKVKFIPELTHIVVGRPVKV